MLFLAHSWRTKPACSAMVSPSLRKLLKHFARNTRAVAKLFLDESDRELFKPSIRRVPRLQPLGITNKTAAMRWLPFVDDNTSLLLTRSIMSYIRHLTASQTTALAQGTLEAKMKRATFRPVPKWHFIISKFVREAFFPYQPSTPYILDDANWTSTCHSCDHERNAHTRNIFSRKTLAKPIWCAGCRKNWPTRTWLCECSLPWFACNTHGTIQPSLQSNVVKSKKAIALMDKATEAKQLAKLNNRTVTPLFSQVGALHAARALASTVNPACKNRCIKFSKVSTVSFQFRNKRKRNSEIIHVLGLDSLNAKSSRTRKRREPPSEPEIPILTGSIVVEPGNAAHRTTQHFNLHTEPVNFHIGDMDGISNCSEPVVDNEVGILWPPCEDEYLEPILKKAKTGGHRTIPSSTADSKFEAMRARIASNRGNSEVNGTEEFSAQLPNLIPSDCCPDSKAKDPTCDPDTSQLTLNVHCNGSGSRLNGDHGTAEAPSNLRRTASFIQTENEHHDFKRWCPSSVDVRPERIRITSSTVYGQGNATVPGLPTDLSFSDVYGHSGQFPSCSISHSNDHSNLKDELKACGPGSPHEQPSAHPADKTHCVSKIFAKSPKKRDQVRVAPSTKRRCIFDGDLNPKHPNPFMHDDPTPSSGSFSNKQLSGHCREPNHSLSRSFDGIAQTPRVDSQPVANKHRRVDACYSKLHEKRKTAWVQTPCKFFRPNPPETFIFEPPQIEDGEFSIAGPNPNLSTSHNSSLGVQAPRPRRRCIIPR